MTILQRSTQRIITVNASKKGATRGPGFMVAANKAITRACISAPDNSLVALNKNGMNLYLRTMYLGSYGNERFHLF